MVLLPPTFLQLTPYGQVERARGADPAGRLHGLGAEALGRRLGFVGFQLKLIAGDVLAVIPGEALLDSAASCLGTADHVLLLYKKEEKTLKEVFKFLP